jgi:hypothetical protein
MVMYTVTDILADARGHYTIGKELVDNVIDRVRRVAGTLLVKRDKESY